MQELLSLHVPAFAELWYRQRLLQDADTMAYNKGYALGFAGYDPKTGCIAFPESEWADWYGYFIGQEPLRYYAYIVRDSDSAFLGEVNLHKAPDAEGYEMGIVFEARHRGKGCAAGALRLLLRHAFEVLDANAVCNDFEETRSAALQAHLSAGFSVTGRKDGMMSLAITRESYFQHHRHA